MHVSAKGLRFGIELECFLPLNRASDVPNNGGAILLGPHGWKGKPDGSILYAAPSGFYGAEVVSPVLCGEEGLIQVWYMIEFLRSLDATTTQACGLHIHFDARTLSEQEAERVRAAFVAYEMAFFGLNGDAIARRLQSTYCRHSLHWPTQTISSSETIYHPGYYVNGVGGWGRSRYQSLNRTNFKPGQTRGKSTFEFRLYENRLDPRTAYTAVYMGAALITKALRDTQPTTVGRYADPHAALVGFVETHYNDQAHLIVPAAESDDVISHADALVVQADSFLRRSRRRAAA